MTVTNTKGAQPGAHCAGQPQRLITVTGGKWTTYRAMAEDVLEKCFDKKSLLPKAKPGSDH
jgi:glycerol-3-phosphate dehydrogenase